MLATPSHVKRRVSRLENVIEKLSDVRFKSFGCSGLKTIVSLATALSPFLVSIAYVKYADYLIEDDYKRTLGGCFLTLACLGFFFTPIYKKMMKHFQESAFKEINETRKYNNKIMRYVDQLERYRQLL